MTDHFEIFESIEDARGSRIHIVIIFDRDIVHMMAVPNFRVAWERFGPSGPSAEWLRCHGVDNPVDSESIAAIAQREIAKRRRG